MSIDNNNNIKFIKFESKETYNKALYKMNSFTFLQTYSWGKFQESVDCAVYRYGLEFNDSIQIIGTFILKKLPFQKLYIYSPNGPLISTQLGKYKNQIIDIFFKKVIEKHKNVIFLRIEPKEKVNLNWYKVNKTINIQPAKTLVLDLLQNEEELLQKMHQKTRYNIRLAIKKGVQVQVGRNEDFDVFWDLISATGERDLFRLHSPEYYKKLLNNLNSDSDLKVKMLIAFYKSKPVSAGLFAFSNNIATYLHGASSDEFRNVMSPYLLLWSAIKIARNNKYKYFDFYGIDENKWPGVTRFKLGFGGNQVECIGTYDVVISQFWYNLYKFIRLIKRF